MHLVSKIKRLEVACVVTVCGVALLGIGLAGCGIGSRTIETTVSKEISEKMNQLRPPAKAAEQGSLPQYADQMLRRNTLQESVADALARIGPEAVPALVEALSSADRDRRENSARALARMGTKATDAVPALIDALRDPDEDVRQNAVRALGQIGTGAKDAIPDLIGMLGKEGDVSSIGQTPRSRPSSAPRYSDPPATTPRYSDPSTTIPRYPESTTTIPRLPGPVPTYDGNNSSTTGATKPNGTKPEVPPIEIPQTLPADQPGSQQRTAPVIPPPGN